MSQYFSISRSFRQIFKKESNKYKTKLLTLKVQNRSILILILICSILNKQVFIQQL